MIGPVWIFAIKHRLPLGTPLSWRREWRDVLLNDAALLAIVVLAWQTIGLGPFLMIQGPIFLLSAAAGVWLFYVQHQFEDTLWAETPEWDFFDAGLKGSSFYDLPPCCTGSPGTSATTTFTTSPAASPTTSWCAASGKSRSCSRCRASGCARASAACVSKLWDEESQRLVGFPRSAAGFADARPSRRAGRADGLAA